MKIALGQINVQSGNIAANIESMKAMIQEAKAIEADIIVFPEMAVSGYYIKKPFLPEEIRRVLYNVMGVGSDGEYQEDRTDPDNSDF